MVHYSLQPLLGTPHGHRQDKKISVTGKSRLPGHPPLPGSARLGVGVTSIPAGFRSCYDEGKPCAKTLFFDFQRKHALTIKVARIFNTYGPGMLPDDGRVVSNFIIQALHNQQITIYGDYTQARYFCFVDDLIVGFLALMNSPDNFTGPVNPGNPREFAVTELAQQIAKLTGSASAIVFLPLPADAPTLRQPDINLALRYWGGNPGWI